MSTSLRVAACTAILPGLVIIGLLPNSAAAQARVEFGPRPARFSVELDLGISLPGTVYDQFMERRGGTSDSLRVSTHWEELTSMALLSRLALRLNPENGVGFFLAGSYSEAASRAQYVGGLAPPEEFERTVTETAIEAGVTFRLQQWRDGRGLLEYFVAPVIHRQVIDLSNGHRDALAHFEPGPAPTRDWNDRTITNWGASLGVAVRIPVTDAFNVRAAFRDMIVPVNTANLAEQESEDIARVSGISPRVSFSPYTSHHMSFSLGFEYTLGWGPPRREVVRRVPEFEDADEEVAAQVENAMRLAAQGDTATAIAALEHRVSVAPRDRYAWRELALLRAARAEDDPTLRSSALTTLERALNMNPGDTELLRAYGRVRGLAQRGGEVVESAVAALRLSDLAVSTQESGAVRLGLIARGLEADEQGIHRYQARIEIFTSDGEAVQLTPGMDNLEEGPDGSWILTGTSATDPTRIAADLFMIDAEPGIYTARVRVTDLATGRESESSAGFEVR